jgi:hypothetical protein
MAAGAGAAEAGDELEQRGLAAPGRADEADEFALGDREVDLLQHRRAAPVLFAYAREGDLRNCRSHHIGFTVSGEPATGSSSREGCPASCSSICVERCQFHESASQGCTAVDGLRS